MEKKTNQRKQQPADAKTELVSQYREIGISSVGALPTRRSSRQSVSGHAGKKQPGKKQH